MLCNRAGSLCEPSTRNIKAACFVVGLRAAVRNRSPLLLSVCFLRLTPGEFSDRVSSLTALFYQLSSPALLSHERVVLGFNIKRVMCLLDAFEWWLCRWNMNGGAFYHSLASCSQWHAAAVHHCLQGIIAIATILFHTLFTHSRICAAVLLHIPSEDALHEDCPSTFLSPSL